MKNTATPNNQPVYRIRITLCLKHDAKYHRAAFVAKEDGAHTWDGSWYTERELDQIKTWKTQAGAERWLAQRPCVKDMAATVEQVTA